MSEKMKNFFLKDTPGRCMICLLALCVITAQRALRGNRELMRRLSSDVIRPLHRRLSILTDKVPFSIAELLILLAGTFVLVLLIRTAVRLVREKERLRTLGLFMMSMLSLVLAVYAGFCVLWGVYYYGDDFMTRASFESRAISAEELETVTAYFAELANRFSSEVPRDAEGVCASERKEILEKSRGIYREAEQECPELEGPPVAAKPFFFSKLLSLTDFSGFFFPFTAEANVNTDFPPPLFAATVAHELAHQRSVAKEQEANFCAVYASLLSGDPDYCYSACLLAYTYLGNALHSVKPEAWERVYGSLNEDVLRDFAVNREYWRKYETPVQIISNTVYEGFLYSYDQDLGLKSYGACVDLLVCRYLEEARAELRVES
jgi:hypothetical protein